MKTELSSPTQHRITSIDMVRGIIMVIMALDHVRDYFHADAFAFDPTDMAKTNPALFFTRWITHFCAPTFVFLSGVSIYLNRQRKSKKELSIFLLTRGVWFIILDIVVIRFGFFFNFYYDMTILNVLWMFGASMILMAALIWLSDWLILILSIAILIGQHFAPALIPVLMGRAFFPLTPAMSVIVAYPILQWLAIMMLGYFFGKIYAVHIPPAIRQRTLIAIGASAIVLFIILRFVNVFGDPAPWAQQKDVMFTLMSFLNTSKYPPSIMFTLMTIGPVLILLAMIEHIVMDTATFISTLSRIPLLRVVIHFFSAMKVNLFRIFYVFGRVPLFYFILHFYIAHALALGLYIITTGKSFADIDFHFANSFGGITSEGGHSLPWVYVAWLTVVLICYPICNWYDQYKTTHKKWWLSYL